MGIDYKRDDYEKALPQWQLIDDICDSENLEGHLIPINAHDDSEEMEARRDAIAQRAVFYEIAGYTANGFLGLVFEKDPTLDLPPQLEYLRTNADGEGLSIYQQAQAVTMDIIRKGRAGLWVDFPTTDKPTSLKDMQDGNIFAPIIHFSAKQIINWRTKAVGSRILLSLVVIEMVREDVGPDGYEIENTEVIRELYLDEAAGDRYSVRDWVKGEKDGLWVIDKEYVPKQGNGRFWKEIPFTFCGAQSNSWRIDKPPMYRICKVNEAHYNNSAVYEDFVFTLGQAAPWMSGITEEHIELMKENHMYFGCANMIGVPAGEQFGIAQAQENTAGKEAMDAKVELMIGLGAMFITPGSATKTAKQSGGEQKTQQSILSLMAANVSEAYYRCLGWAALFMKTKLTDDNEFSLNQTYVEPDSTPQMLTAVVADFLQGSMPMSDFYQWKKDNGFTSKETFEDFADDIEGARQEALDLDEDAKDNDAARQAELLKAKEKSKPKPKAGKKK